MRHLERERPLGVEPHLVIVFELGASINVDEFRRSGLRVVDSSHSRVVVAFADDPELAAFHERLNALEGGIPEGRKNEPYADFFDAIEDLRSLGPDDRITEDLRGAVRSNSPDAELRIDVECWHPGEADRAVDWLNEVRAAVEVLGGRFVDSMVSDAIGLLLARVYIPAGRVMELAELDVIARIDVLPIPALSVSELFDTSINEFPDILPPHTEAPIVGIVDSGVASAHVLIAGAVVASDALGTGITDDQDEHGHGTMVASIVLHGDVAKAIARGFPLRPMCRIVSARVLDADNQFPVDELWERDLADAITWCVEQGASIVNLSVGDDRSPFQPPRQMSAAAVVDDLARRYGLVVVAAAGNSRPADYIEIGHESAAVSYPAALLKAEGVGLIDPATSMIALTVGGMTDAVAASGLTGTETVRRSRWADRTGLRQSPESARVQGAPSSRRWFTARAHSGSRMDGSCRTTPNLASSVREQQLVAYSTGVSERAIRRQRLLASPRPFGRAFPSSPLRLSGHSYSSRPSGFPSRMNLTVRWRPDAKASGSWLAMGSPQLPERSSRPAIVLCSSLRARSRSTASTSMRSQCHRASCSREGNAVSTWPWPIRREPG